VLRTCAIALLLAAAILATFAPTFHAQFLHWDDEPLIYQNPHLNPPNLAGLEWHWTHPHVSMYVPLAYTTWWLLARFSGGAHPLVFHLANLAVHWFSSWMVFLILRRLTGKTWPAVAGAWLFAVHPLQVEPVAWATGMKDLLSGALSLAALALYLNWAQRKRYSIYAEALALYLLALLAKPAAISVPLIAAAIEIVWLGNSWKRAATWLVPWLILAIPIVIVAKNLQPAQEISNPLLARPLVAADALAFYLFKLIYPQNLGVVYGRQPAMILHPIWHGIAPVAVTWIVPTLAAIGVFIFRRYRGLVAAALVFVFALLPTLGLVHFDFQRYSTVADRYVYVAMLGPAMLAAWWLARSPGPKPTTAAIGVLAALSARSFMQAQTWHDNLTLFHNAVIVDPASAAMHRGYGVALNDAGDVADATEQYLILLKLQPNSPDILKYVADAESQMGNSADAARYAQQLIDLQLRLHPIDTAGLVFLHLWRGEICEIWGDNSPNPAERQQAYQQAVQDYQEAMNLNPDNPTSLQKFLAVHHKLDAISN
jgi:protein O-mannosyl-transferase